MKVVVRETMQLDPVWAFRAGHVHHVLSLVVSYWADEVGAYVDLPPSPIGAKDPGKAAATAVAKKGRAEALQDISARPVHVEATVSAAMGEIAFLHAAVLWEAVRDWADNCFSPVAVDQRRALQSYWWFMSLPYAAPRGMSADAWSRVAAGKRRKHKVSAAAEDPLREVGLTTTSLWVMRETDPVVPPVFRDGPGPITFLRCCQVLGLYPNDMRRFLHTVGPD